MCSYFNPDCYWCKEYDARVYICANNARWIGDTNCEREEDDEKGCEGCPSLIKDSVTAYHCTRDRCVNFE